MSFRAIFFDIDGTLLGRDKRMPPSTLHALKKARENGVLLFVATGRVTPMTYFLRDYFDFDGFAAMTGQYCFDKNGKVLHTLAIDPEDIRLLMQLQKEEPFPCLIAEGRECFAATPAKQIDENFTDIICPRLPSMTCHASVNTRCIS
ncbi:HAD hydrolase family protein [Hominenteromicrobium sp.]|uniref:HAD hydrolase family protein n=1 Tax=Hominenteromicrobium sp. TaxID=3073581 RepID=UPI003A95B3E4